MKNLLNIKHVCFDLDGTLMDSHRTIFKATVTALDKLKIKHQLLEEDLYKRIGHHFVDIFSELKIGVDDFELFINIYKSRYFDFIDSSKIYPDTLHLIQFLNDKNTAVTLLTTKAQDQADRILKHFSLTPMFNYIMGRRPELRTKPSPEPLLKICEEINIEPEFTMMVGDTELDIQCGKAAGAITCAVAHGYRTIEQLKEEKPDFIVKNMKELIDLF